MPPGLCAARHVCRPEAVLLLVAGGGSLAPVRGGRRHVPRRHRLYERGSALGSHLPCRLRQLPAVETGWRVEYAPPAMFSTQPIRFTGGDVSDGTSRW